MRHKKASASVMTHKAVSATGTYTQAETGCISMTDSWTRFAQNTRMNSKPVCAGVGVGVAGRSKKKAIVR